MTIAILTFNEEDRGSRDSRQDHEGLAMHSDLQHATQDCRERKQTRALAAVCGFGAIIAAWIVFGPRDFSFGQPPVKQAPDVTVGKQLYITNCAACHGEKGDGNGPM